MIENDSGCNFLIDEVCFLCFTFVGVSNMKVWTKKWTKVWNYINITYERPLQLNARVLYIMLKIIILQYDGKCHLLIAEDWFVCLTIVEISNTKA